MTVYRLTDWKILRFFTCVSRGNFPSTNLAGRADYSYTSPKFSICSFYNSLFWDLEICSHLFLICSFLCSFLFSILSILSLFYFSFCSLFCFILPVYSLYLLMSLIVFFLNLLSFLFFSLFLCLLLPYVLLPFNPFSFCCSLLSDTSCYLFLFLLLFSLYSFFFIRV